MDSQTTCADCGIRFSTRLTECPWCGAEAPEPPAPAIIPDRSGADTSGAWAPPEAVPSAETLEAGDDVEAPATREPSEPETTQPDDLAIPGLDVGASQPDDLAHHDTPTTPTTPLLDVGASEPDDLAIPGLDVGASQPDDLAHHDTPTTPTTPLLDVGASEPDDLAIPGLDVGASQPDDLAHHDTPTTPTTPLLDVGASEPDDLAIPGLDVGASQPDDLAHHDTPTTPTTPLLDVGASEPDDLAIPGLDVGASQPDDLAHREVASTHDEQHVMAAMEAPPPRTPPPVEPPAPGPPPGTPVELVPAVQQQPDPVPVQAGPGGPEEPPPPRRSRARAWLINGGLIVGLLLIGALIAEFAPIGGSDDPDPTTPATVALPTTTPPVATTLPPATTTPPQTSATTTTQPTTTTTEPPTTTTTRPPIDPIGDAIAINDLRMGVDVLGPLALGSDGAEVVGRLVASLGQPTTETGVITSQGEAGTCQDDLVRVVQFGSLSIINEVGDDGTETFAAYRLLVDPDGPVYPADALQTISGISAGDTVAQLKSIYASLVIELVEVEGSPAFELRRGSDRGLLLWGPVTATDDSGIIRGVYSRDACSA